MIYHGMRFASKAVVLADGSQLHQVILNLCSNAAHAMQDKGGILDVHLVDVVLNGQAIPNNADPARGTYVQLTIRDMGGGIDPQIINRIFDPFFTTKKQGVGTGLGLAVAHGIVKSHGGIIDVDSRVGEGANFFRSHSLFRCWPLPSDRCWTRTCGKKPWIRRNWITAGGGCNSKRCKRI